MGVLASLVTDIQILLLLTQFDQSVTLEYYDPFSEISTRSLLQDAISLSESSGVDTCEVLLHKFSVSTSNFTMCANQFARPINMCRECKEYFISVRDYYNALEHSDAEGINCKNLLTSQDKVEIIQETHDFIVGKEGLWAKGFCSSCYTSPLEEGSLLKNDTITFFALYRSVRDCFDVHPDNNITEKSEACTECAIDYNKLLTFFRETFLDDEFPYINGICFDILDAMNQTQQQWGSGHYHCGRKIRGSAPLLTAVLLVLVTPVVLYLMVRFAPGTRTAQERVITQTTIQEIISQAQEEASVREISEEDSLQTQEFSIHDP